MININDFIEETLKTINIPIRFQIYDEDETTYITYLQYLGQNEKFSEDVEEIKGHYVQINVFSLGDYTDIVTQVELLMKDADFKKTNETDLYEEKTHYFHKGLRYFYAEDLTI
ncbi:hypothetical protein [Clostridium estertheticum]|uniref:hypothetical protein n=1 Tax=Clostridium estertheticum TaxID=238834 RepID=UPI001C0E579D|nr:hypothetical protein [Clostridium estertheticum]MBU3216649.1 hypothetical protein [Clostridium estertheticum]MCB2340899.1 hypothetical protein [Clostridium estertheticum]WAG54396.1 hypothetical protein LL033_17430 [Clostridium estertheticum]